MFPFLFGFYSVCTYRFIYFLSNRLHSCRPFLFQMAFLQNRSISLVDMYIDNAEPTENVGQIHFSLEYDFRNTTLILRILTVSKGMILLTNTLTRVRARTGTHEKTRQEPVKTIKFSIPCSVRPKKSKFQFYSTFHPFVRFSVTKY